MQLTCRQRESHLFEHMRTLLETGLQGIYTVLLTYELFAIHQLALCTQYVKSPLLRHSFSDVQQISTNRLATLTILSCMKAAESFSGMQSHAMCIKSIAPA